MQKNVFVYHSGVAVMLLLGVSICGYTMFLATAIIQKGKIRYYDLTLMHGRGQLKSCLEVDCSQDYLIFQVHIDGTTTSGVRVLQLNN